MNLRKLSALVLAAALCFSLAVPALAADLTFPVTGGNLCFDAATGVITSCDKSVTEAEIPAEINGVPVTAIGPSAFAFSNVEKVTLPDSVSEIGAFAFNGCSSLAELSLGDGVTRIGLQAFGGCESLTEVIFGSSVASIGPNAFFHCENLESITLPEGIQSIAATAFALCDKLTDVFYGGTVLEWARIEGGISVPAVTIHYGEDALTLPDALGGFTDVLANGYFAKAVEWAVDNGITNGIGGGLFGVTNTVTRAQAVTFLWRAAGQPEPESLVSPFSDVTDLSAWYGKAVLWAAEQGITVGVGDGQFGLNGTLTYEQMLTFMCRAAGGDAAGSDWAQAALDWAAENGLTDGLTITAKGDCPRCDVVYFLWKQLG